eukprot:1149472-Pelagomonas_calceolata.AAC.8
MMIKSSYLHLVHAIKVNQHDAWSAELYVLAHVDARSDAYMLQDSCFRAQIHTPSKPCLCTKAAISTLVEDLVGDSESSSVESKPQ